MELQPSGWDPQKGGGNNMTTTKMLDIVQLAKDTREMAEIHPDWNNGTTGSMGNRLFVPNAEFAPSDKPGCIVGHALVRQGWTPNDLALLGRPETCDTLFELAQDTERIVNDSPVARTWLCVVQADADWRAHTWAQSVATADARIVTDQIGG